MLEGMQGVSTYAQDIDRALWIVTGLCIFLFVVTIGAMLYFAVKYNAKRNPKENTQNIKHYTPIEIAWTVIPTILLMVMFYYGLDTLRLQRTMPDDAINVDVVGKRWSWTFTYENGKKTSDLYVPIGTNIKLSLTAPKNDVLHSFYVPAFRTKEDVIPAQTNYLWFNATEVGSYDIECAEYCGTRHAYMLSKVVVLPVHEYEEWYSSSARIPGQKVEVIEPKGKVLMEQNGCFGCHGMDGNVLVGPALNDIYNKNVRVMIDGETKEVMRDDSYLIESILYPNKHVVEGYTEGMMPAFEGVLSKEDTQEILNYLKGEVPTQKKGVDAKDVLNTNGCLGCHSLDGSKMVGPSFKDIFMRQTKVVTEDGTNKEIIANEEYLINAILKPNKEVVEGYYPGVMPSFDGVLSEEELKSLIHYFKGEETATPKIDAQSLLELNGCLGCHSLDGSKMVGPSFKGLVGRTTKVVTENGENIEVIADEAYLINAILNPDKEVVEGFYPGIMPSFEGVLSQDEIDAIIKHFKGLP